MSGAYDFVSLLGLPPQDPLALNRRLERGLPYQAFEKLQRAIALSTSELAEAASIKVRTLHRRREQGRFEPDESDRLLRISRVLGQALELFEGDAAAAGRWIRSPQRGLGGERPLALARTDVGTREILALMGRLEHGIVA